MESGTMATALSKRRIVLVLAMTIVESFLFGFLIDGWPSLTYMFSNDGVFSEFCPSSPENYTPPAVISAYANVFRQSRHAMANGNDAIISALPRGYNNTSSGNSSSIPGGEPAVIAAQMNGSTVVQTTEPPAVQVCAEQQSLMNLVLMLSNVVGEGSSFLCGILFDRLGLFRSRLIQFAIMFSGSMMMTFTNTDLSPIIFVSATLLCCSSMMLIISNTHLALLAGCNQSAVLGVTSMCVALTSFIPGIMQVAYDAGVSRQTCFYVYSGLMVIHLVDTFCLIPRYKVCAGGEIHEAPEDALPTTVVYTSTPDSGCTSTDGCSQDSEDSSAGIKPLDTAARSMESAINLATKPKAMSFSQIVVSFLFVNHLLWFAFNQLHFWYELGIFYTWTAYITDNVAEKIDAQTLIFQCANILVLVAPLIGVSTDYISRRRNEEKSTPQDSSYEQGLQEDHILVKKDRQSGASALIWDAVSLCPALLLTCLASNTLGMATLSNSQSAGVAASLLTALLKGSLFTTYYTFCQRVYPNEHYGKLVGLGATIANLFNLLEIPIFYWAQSSTPLYTPANTLILVFSLLTLAHPLIIVIRYKTMKH